MTKNNLKKLSTLLSDIDENINNNEILDSKKIMDVKFKDLNGFMYEFNNCLETKKIFIDNEMKNGIVNIMLINIDDIVMDKYSIDLNKKDLDLNQISEEILFTINDEAEGLDLYRNEM